MAKKKVTREEEIKELEDLMEDIKVPQLENAPETLEDAVRRIMQLETALDDLVRATEIAQYSKQYHLAEVYMAQAEELLQDRIIVPELEQGDFNLTVIEGNADETLIKRVADQRA